jgi:hypothetical protein
MKKILIIISLLSLYSCRPAREFTRNQQDYHDRAMQQPLEFSIPKEKAQDAWGRAQAFVAQHSSMKLQIATDYALTTYTPNGGAYNFGYDISRAPIGDSSSFKVECIASFYLDNDEANMNAHVCSYFIATSQVPPDGLMHQ